MEWIAALEKLKNPFVALVAGALFGVSATWTAITNLHEERIKILDTARGELERQLAMRDKEIEQKNTELKILSSKLSEQLISVSPQPQSSEKLQKFIAQLDDEIGKKKVELMRHSSLSVGVFDESGRHDKPESDTEVRIEQDLKALNEQRNAARQRLIEGMSK